jgi:hypothetical protein
MGVQLREEGHVATTMGPGGQGPGNDPIPLGYVGPQNAPNLKPIAWLQKGIILCILTQIITFCGLGILGMMIKQQNGTPPTIGMGLFSVACDFLFFAAWIAGTVFTFMLAISLYNTGTGVVMGLNVFSSMLGPDCSAGRQRKSNESSATPRRQSRIFRGESVEDFIVDSLTSKPRMYMAGLPSHRPS